jgi:hypothetical protein
LRLRAASFTDAYRRVGIYVGRISNELSLPAPMR